MEIIPAIMPRKYEDIEARVKDVYGLVRTVQIDVMDGVFTPTKSWPYVADEEIFKKLISGAVKLPYADECRYSADLMITNPQSEVSQWIDAGFTEIIIHVGSTDDVFGIINICNEASVGIGIALKTTTPNEAIYPFMQKIDFVQCMGIAEIGYQGNPYDERVIPKIRDLRDRYPEAIIQVDGGVNSETAPELIKAGAKRLVVGSALWKSPAGIKNALRTLQSLR